MPMDPGHVRRFIRAVGGTSGPLPSLTARDRGIAVVICAIEVG